MAATFPYLFVLQCTLRETLNKLFNRLPDKGTNKKLPYPISSTGLYLHAAVTRGEVVFSSAARVEVVTCVSRLRDRSKRLRVTEDLEPRVYAVVKQRRHTSIAETLRRYIRKSPVRNIG